MTLARPTNDQHAAVGKGAYGIPSRQARLAYRLLTVQTDRDVRESRVARLPLSTTIPGHREKGNLLPQPVRTAICP